MTEMPSPSTVRAANSEPHHIVVVGKGGTEQLRWTAFTPDSLPTDSVRVQVDFAGLAFADTMARRGLYPAIPPYPYVPGYDFAGTITEVGQGVVGLSVGQRVAGFLTKFGTHTEQLVAPASSVVPFSKLKSEVAACLPVNYLTAHYLLFEAGKLKTGDTVFINSAAGGVGTAVLELARLSGIRAYGSASAAKGDTIRQLGAVAFDRQHDVLAELKKAVPEGVHLYIEQVADLNQPSGYSAVRRGGTYLVNGLLSARGTSWLPYTKFFVPYLLRKLVPDGRQLLFNSGIQNYVGQNRQWFKETMQRIIGWAEEGKLNPIIGATIPLARAANAHQLLEESGAKGKIILDCRPSAKSA